jgi:hypothetical protein
MRWLQERLAIAGISTAVITSVVVSGVRASSDFCNNSPHPVGNNDPHFISEIRSLDIPADYNDDENDSATAQSASPTVCAPPSSSGHAESATPMPTPSIVGSSLLYEGGCVVSSEAMMCSSAADCKTERRSSTSLDSVTSFLHQLLDGQIVRERMDHDFSVEYDEERDGDSDDDDGADDDDDQDGCNGHSSMLSNAFVRRSKSSRTSLRLSPSGSGRSVASGGSLAGLERTAYLEGEILLHKQGRRVPYSRHSRSPLLSVVSSLRGGAGSSDLSKKLINSAIVTLIFEACIGHILEFFKIVLQTSLPGTTYASVYKDITSEKGIGGLWDGFIPWGVLQAVLKGGVFGLAYAVASTILKPLAEEGVMPMKLAMALSGGIAGGFQGYVLSPTLLMKTRVMTNEVFRESMSLWQTTWKSMVIGGDIIKSEGLGSLMKGANTFATKRVFDWASRYYFADLFEAMFVKVKGSSLSVTEQIISSLLGGIASTVLTLPLDVLVAKTQDAKKAGVKVSALRLFSDELEKEGWVGLRNNYMKGFEARLVHVCLTTVVMKTIEPLVYDRFFKV